MPVPHCCSHIQGISTTNKKSSIFSSDSNTKHVRDYIANSNVADSIALETQEVSKIQWLYE